MSRWSTEQHYVTANAGSSSAEGKPVVVLSTTTALHRAEQRGKYLRGEEAQPCSR